MPARPSLSKSCSNSLLGLLPSLLLACHGVEPANSLDDGGAPTQPDPSESARSAQPPAKPRDRSVTIPRRSGDAPHEVELDPRAEVALTVDKLGRMRLWPAIRSGDGALALPYELPMEGPLWMSVAQADDGFVVATIDTTNAGSVVAVTPSAAGRDSDQRGDAKQAKLTPLFSLPPSDPLLELHALDGGQRFLALGVDHRVRLYDRSGAEIAVIDQRGFVPWQLRVVHAELGQPPKIAAMLASPLRVQAIELRDDTLSIKGEARAVVLDRGPNRNDLLLGPDGKTVAALRRRSGRGRDFSIELIDLETDARRLVAGQTDSSIRPRMHFVDAGRILLETGSRSGRGIWVDLSKAEALTDPADADPDSELAKRLAKRTNHDSIPLAASAEIRPEFFEPEFDPPWDHGERLHASVVAGIRVNIERTGEGQLIVDPLDSDRHWVFWSGAGQHAAALDRDGAHQASASDGKLWVARVDAPDEGVEFDHGLSSRFVTFADDRRVLIVDHRGKVELIDWQAGQVVASTKLDFKWSLESIAYRQNPSGTGGVLGWRGDKPSEPVRLLTVANGALGEVTELAQDQRPQWIELLDLGDREAAAMFGMTEAEADDELDEYTSDRKGRLFFTKKHPRTPLFVRDGDVQRELRLPAGQGRELSVSPDGSKIAIVQFRERDDDGVIEDHLCSVLDVATGERLWTFGHPGRIALPRWSEDGSRIVVQATVRDATTGEVVAERSPGIVNIEERADADWARQPG